MIYVHIPFCRSFCTYCDFYSEVASKCRRAEDDQLQSELFTGFSKALGREIADRAGEMSDDVNTLYIGGGTPSVLPLSVYTSLMQDLASVGIRAPFDEFTFEVNPEDIVEKGGTYVEQLLELGVNRISMGVQSFDDGILKWMNRRHDSRTAVNAYHILEDVGVDNISIDLIFGLSQLTDSKWEETLKRAMEISSKGVVPRHVSSYQLSVEPGSALARLVDRGVWQEASDELCEGQYRILCKTLAGAGYHHYEISNFAQPGYEARHNSAYWAHVPYVGLGPAAHSFLAIGQARCIPVAPSQPSWAPPPSRGWQNATSMHSALPSHEKVSGVRQWNRDDLRAYIADPKAVQEYETLEREQLVLERIMLGLRTSEGLPADFLKCHCRPEALQTALDNGDLVPSGVTNLRIPENRFFVSDAIILELCAET